MNKLEKENYSIRNLLVGKSKPTVADDTLTPIVFVCLCTTQHTHPKIKTLKCLLDSGSSATLVKKKHVKLLHLSKSNPTMWKTSAGTFKTTKKVEVKMTLPELHSRRVITHKMYVCPTAMHYDMIIGRDLLIDLGIDIQFSTKTVKWDHAEIPMKPQSGSLQNSYHIEDSIHVTKEMERISKILDAGRR